MHTKCLGDGADQLVLVGLQQSNLDRLRAKPLHSFIRVDAEQHALPLDLMLVSGESKRQIMAMVVGKPIGSVPEGGFVRVRTVLAGRPTLLLGLAFSGLDMLSEGGAKRFERRPGIPLTVVVTASETEAEMMAAAAREHPAALSRDPAA